MKFKPKEIKIELFKSSGPGGQHKNKRFTAVRLRHLSSGLQVICQRHRSLAQNKKEAFERLELKLRLKAVKKKKRIPTKKSKAVREKVLCWKKRHSAKKKARSKKIDTE